MNYSQFKTEYNLLLNRMMGYTPDQAGSNIYASKLADLVDDYPEFEEQYDNEEDL